MQYSKDEICRMVETIDRFLADKGVPIPHRSMEALRLISQELNIEITVLSRDLPFPDPLLPTDEISLWVSDWYDERYGDKQKIDFSVGKFALRIRGDIWLCKVPLVYGTLRLYCARVTVPSKEFTGDGTPVLYNVLDSIEDFPDGIRKVLTDEEIRAIFNDFVMAYNSYYSIISHVAIPLIKSALSDHHAAVNHLLVRDPHAGQSKWASQQAVEKVIKALIQHHGKDFSKVHNLVRLASELEATAGINLPKELLKLIQCGSEVRYDESGVGLDDALQAHHAALTITHLCGRHFGLGRSTEIKMPNSG